MAATLFTYQTRAVGADGDTLSGAKWYFYATGTTTPRAVYANAALTISLGAVVTADSGGKFVPIYLDASLTYRAVLKDASGTTIFDIDPVNTESSILQSLADSDGAELIGYGSGTVASALAATESQLRLLNASQTADAMLALATAGTVTIALEGTSITYCQDTVNVLADTNAPINGSSYRRSKRVIEADLDEALTLSGASVGVINRGFPGDNTTLGLTRWANVAAVDFVWLEYGHNDANNYGGHGVVAPAAYSTNLEAMVIRRINQGAGVGIIIPPNVQIPSQNVKLQTYRTAARMVAEKYGCLIFDAPHGLQGITSPWNDLVHLSSHAISDWAWCLAATMLGGSTKTICAGDTINPDDGMLVSSGSVSMFVDDRSHAGTFMNIAAGGTVLLAANFQDNVYPVIKGYNETTDGLIGISYAFGASTFRGTPETMFTLDFSESVDQSIVGPQVRRGVRMIAIKNYGGSPFYIENISFEASPSHMSRGLARAASGMHVCQPMKLSAVSSNWWTHVDTSMRLKAPFRATFFLDLDETAINGAALWTDPLQTGGDFCSDTGLLIVRDGTDLLAYELVDGVPTSATTAAAAFSSSRERAQLYVTLEDGELKVWIDGAASPVITRTSTPILAGYPGLISDKAAYLESFGFVSTGEVKGPYA